MAWVSGRAKYSSLVAYLRRSQAKLPAGQKKPLAALEGKIFAGR